MNSLSWFLYVGDIIGNLSLLGAIASSLWLSFGVYFCFVYTKSTTWNEKEAKALSWKRYEYVHQKAERAEFVESALEKVAKAQEQDPPSKLLTLVLPSVFLVLSFLLPSKEAVYLIAGSEAGEAVVTSDEGKQILNDIHEVIKYQLNSYKE